MPVILCRGARGLLVGYYEFEFNSGWQGWEFRCQLVCCVMATMEQITMPLAQVN